MGRSDIRGFFGRFFGREVTSVFYEEVELILLFILW